MSEVHRQSSNAPVRRHALFLHGQMDEKLNEELHFILKCNQASTASPRYRHSLRRTVAGCTREARHAGSKHAIVATPNRSAMTPANTTGSSGLVAYKLERSERADAHLNDALQMSVPDLTDGCCM